MKKYIALLSLLIISIYSIGFASEQDIVNSFTEFANSQIQPIRESYARKDTVVYRIEDNKRSREITPEYIGFYRKKGATNLQAGYDLKKTDSLVNPYLGIISMSNESLSYFTPENRGGYYKTREAAEKAFMVRNLGTGFDMKFYYTYNNGQWILNKVTNYSGSYIYDYDLNPPAYYFLIK